MRRYALLLAHLCLLAALLSGCRPIQRPAAAGDQPPAAQPAAQPAAPTAAGEPLPMDPEVRTGRLANGFTWYVRPNAATAERAELWLVVNAGSAVEADDQRGLAHFIEHMQFQGTENFPGQEPILFLQSLGTEFGPEINAYTTFDETVYTLQVPTDDPMLVQGALDLLADWSGRATFDPDAVDAERPVIVEEWRTRDLGAEGRVSEALHKALLGGSRYAEHLPIGDMETVRTAPVEALREFYTTWYRPDNMAVIAVGDFADPDTVEQWIAERFGALPAATTPMERPDLAVPDYGDTGVQIITDPEYPATAVSVAFRQPQRSLLTTGDYRTLLMDYLVVMMLNDRYKEIARKPDAAFLFAGAGISNLVRGLELNALGVRTEEDRVLGGLGAAMAEIERVRQHGFTPAEMDKAKTQLLREFESRSAEQANLTNRVYAGGLLGHFLNGSISTGFGDDYTITQDLLPTISLDDVLARFDALYHTGNRAVVLLAPTKAAASLPDADQLAAVLDAAAAQTLAPYVAPEDAAEAAAGDAAAAADTATPETGAGEGANVAAASAANGSLLAAVPEPAAIVEEEEFAGLGITRIKLENGVQVYFKPTDFKDDEVLLTLSSLGGVSLVADEDVPAAAFADSLVVQSGVGPYTVSALEKLLADKRVSITPYIGELDEGFTGGGSPQDLETVFQLIYLFATQPRLDPDVPARFGRAMDEYLNNRQLQPSAALDDKFLELFCGDDPRCNSVALTEGFRTVDPQRALELYQQRFADLDDAVGVLVGAFDLAEAKELAQRYLGALPSTAAAGEMWQDKRHPLPDGPITETVYGGVEDRSEVRIYFTGPLSATLENQVALVEMTEMLKGIVAEDLRQTRAGIYSADIASNVTSVPSGRYQVSISFTAEPARVEELTDAVFEEVALLRELGPTASNYARVLRQLRRNHEENLQNNGAWMQWIVQFVLNEQGPLSEIERIDEVIDTVSPEDVQALADELLQENRSVTLILHPTDFEK